MKATHCDLCSRGQRNGPGGDWCPCHAGYKRPSWKVRAERLRIRILNGGARAMQAIVAGVGWRRV